MQNHDERGGVKEQLTGPVVPPHRVTIPSPTGSPRTSLVPSAAATAHQRLLISGLSLLTLVVGTVASAAGVDDVRTVALLLYCTIGAGFGPWNLRPHLSLPERTVLAGLTSVSVGTFAALLMMSLGTWRPLTAFAVIGAGTALTHVVALRRAVRDLPRGAGGQAHSPVHSARPGRTLLARPTRALLPMVAAVGGTVLCLVAALTHRGEEVPPFWGFPAQIGPLWYLGLVLLLGSTLLALARGGSSAAALPIVALTIVLVLTPALVYDGPRSQSAQKHVELVQQIRSWHELRSSVAVYNAWPGFFAVNAWWCDVAGLRDPLRLATYWPVLLAGLRLAALRQLAGRLLGDRRAVWAAVLLAVLADPLGADYYSPQSIGFVLGLIIFGIALDRTRRSPNWALLLLAGCLVTVTHQLSPFVISGILVLLVLFRQLRPWWVPGLVLGPAVVWAVWHRAQLAPFLSFGALGNPANFRPPQTAGSSDLERLPVVPATVVALLVCVGVTGLLALVTLVRTRRSAGSWALAAAPAVGLALVAANPYGQEGIFRAVLFGMPWLAVLAAPALVGVPVHHVRTLRVLARTGPVVLVLTSAFLVAAFGLDRITVTRPSDVAVLARLQELTQEDDRSAQTVVVFLGTGNLPTSAPLQGWNGIVLSDEQLDIAPGQLPQDQVADQATDLTAALEAYIPSTATDVYAVWSPTISDYQWAYGVQSPDQFATLRDGLLASPQWSVVDHSGGTYAFRLDRSGTAVGVAVP